MFFAGWAFASGLGATPASSAIALLSGLTLTSVLWWSTAWMWLPGGWSISAEALHYTLFTRMREWRSARIAGFGAMSAAFAAATHVALVATPARNLVADAPLAYQWAVTMAPWSTIPYFTIGLLLGRAPNTLSRFVTSHKLLTLAIGTSAFAFTAFKGSLVPIDAVWVALAFETVRHSRLGHVQLIAWVGRRSYGTYFTHFVVLAGSGSLLALLDLHPDRGGIEALSATAAVLLASSGLAQLLWVSIERRALQRARSVAAAHS